MGSFLFLCSQLLTFFLWLLLDFLLLQSCSNVCSAAFVLSKYATMLCPNLPQNSNIPVFFIIYYFQGCDSKKVKHPEKLVAGLSLPLVERTKPPWTSWMFNFRGFTDSSRLHKQETRGLDTIQATSFFPWWLLLFFQENFEAKGDL